MSYSRRQFVRDCSSAVSMAALGAMVPGTRRAYRSPVIGRSARAMSTRSRIDVVDPAQTRTLALAAIDAATHAGAQYADVRLTRTIHQDLGHIYPYQNATARTLDTKLFFGELVDRESYAVGVRACIGGAWGFAASAVWDLDTVTALAREAARQATANAHVTRSVSLDFGQYPVATGSWLPPHVIDPFTVPAEEKLDFFQAHADLVAQYHDVRAPRESHWYQEGVSYLAHPTQSSCTYQRQERAVATTDGAYFTQTLYETSGVFGVNLAKKIWQLGNRSPYAAAYATGLVRAGKGWELFLDARLDDQIPQLVETASRQADCEVTSVDVGRYDIVCDAEFVAALLDHTIGPATELDRALGDEANGVGTSYLGPDPTTWLGAAPIAAPLVTVTANRSMVGGLATVHWDDEGVRPDAFTLVQDGVLVDYQTTRAQAASLASWYARRGQAVRSHGCAGAPDAASFTLQQRPNLVLEPGQDEVRFEDLIKDTKRGVAVRGGGEITTDFQGRTGVAFPYLQEIVNGQLGAIIASDGLSRPGVAFNALDIWKNVVARGGPASATTYPGRCTKGQPLQQTSHSISAVPLKMINIPIIDGFRRA